MRHSADVHLAHQQEGFPGPLPSTPAASERPLQAPRAVCGVRASETPTFQALSAVFRTYYQG